MKKNVDLLKCDVQIIALELAIPALDKKKPDKPHFVTMVMKRGKKERVENVTSKIKYVPLAAES